MPDMIQIVTETRGTEKIEKPAHYARGAELTPADVEDVDRNDGRWYVSTTAIDGKDWRLFADVHASEPDVKHLLRKKYSALY